MGMIIVPKEPQGGQCGWGEVREGCVVKKNYKMGVSGDISCCKKLILKGQS